MSAPADSRAEPGLGATLALYTLARLALLALIAGLLLLAGTPLMIALLVALIVALPLSMLVFRGLRTRLDVALAASRTRRAEERAALRAGLRGEDGAPHVPSGDRSEREPDAGGDRPDQQ
jgi:Flp pilus assembly protein TadB